MPTARTEMESAPPKEQQNKLKAKTSVKKTETIELHKNCERGRTKSGEKNKMGVGQESMRQFLIGKEEI